MTAPACPYCNRPAGLRTGADIYPHRRDLRKLQFWCCWHCDARVGCHPGTTEPLGRLADRRLRNARGRAHRAFDPIWRGKHMTRSGAYAWLAGELGIDVDDCHMAQLDEEQCARVVEICRARATT